jgi:hypothetical protein
MDGTVPGGLNVSTVDMVKAADGFAAASAKTQHHASALEEVLRPYALHPDRFQGPQADAFRRLYGEIADELQVIRGATTDLSELVNQAKAGYSASANSAEAAIPTPSGSGHVLQGLSGR